MLTYRTGAAGTPSVAKGMSEYLAAESQVPEMAAVMADYYKNSSLTEAMTAALPRRDMHPLIAEKLGIDQNRPLSTEEVTNLLTGLRADGGVIPGKRVHKVTDKKTRIGYIDLTLSAPKSFSVALAFAPTEAERAILDRAHRDAVDATAAYIAQHIGRARKGDGGKHGYDAGHIAWVQFDHYTARPTAKIPVTENGIETTELVSVNVAGDPQRHTHIIIPNVVVTDEGRVTGLDLQKIKDRVHEYGKIYQAFLATNLRRSGVDIGLDDDTLMSRIHSVPRSICELFSKRTTDGEEAAKAYAETQGIDWDSLSGKGKTDMLKGATKARRLGKEGDLAEFKAWHAQAAAVGYRHRSVLRPDEKKELETEGVRQAKAYKTSLPVMAEELAKRSKFGGSVARLAALCGFIEHGIDDPAKDIAAVTKAYRTEGVLQDGKMTALAWGKAVGDTFASFTTELHAEQEREAISLIQAAAADKSTVLSPESVERAVQKVTRERGKNFTNEHGRLQREMVDRVASSGRAAVLIGVAGSGKTTLLQPLIEAWHEAGRTTYGVTLAWRQTDALKDAGVGRARRAKKMEPDTDRLTEAGVGKDHAFALTAFLKGIEKGRIQVDRNSVVIMDEIAQVGTRQLLQFARLQDKHGFQFVGLGDQQQCQAIEAGSTIRLFQKALGEDQVPEILNTVRQKFERDQKTSLMFRDGKAAEALSRKDEDGRLMIVPGGYKQAIEKAVDLWEERRIATVDLPNYTVSISVPTNSDARAIGAEVRKRRQTRGEVGRDRAVLEAIDQTGVQYRLPVAAGDRLRLFNRVNASFTDANGKTHGGRIGNNGSVVEVLEVTRDGMNVRNRQDREGFIKWNTIRDKKTGRIRLTYGDALTIDARQGDTVSEHITVMPSGSKAVNAYKAYTADSRHEVTSWLITSQGEEMNEIVERRPLGDPRNWEKDPAKNREAVIANMARNLSQRPEKVLATDFLESIEKIRKGTVRAMQAAWHRKEAREQRHGAPDPAKMKQRMAAHRNAAAVKKVSQEVSNQLEAINRVMETLSNVQMVEPTPAVTQPVSSRQPPAPQKPLVITETEAQAEFADALYRMGFRLKGAPVMDGRLHRAPVEGDRGKKMSGSYKAGLNGRPAGYIHNFKTGEETVWKASQPLREMTAEERRAAERALKQERMKRAAERLEYEERASMQASTLWRAADRSDGSHAYLQKKQVGAHGIRVGQAGQVADLSRPGEKGGKLNVEGWLFVPMRDTDGKLWNLQMISPDGQKVFLPGRKQGLFATMGRAKPGEPAVITEGYATGATWREVAGFTTVVAFDSGNIPHVAKAIRDKAPDQGFVFGADNDHHLPRREKPLPNVGIEKARAAAEATGGVVVAPSFPPDAKDTDWNDYRVRNGIDATRRAIAAQLAQGGIALPAAPAMASEEAREAARQKTQPIDPAAAQRAALQQSREVQWQQGRGR